MKLAICGPFGRVLAGLFANGRRIAGATRTPILVYAVVANVFLAACDSGPEPKLAALRQETVASMIPAGSRLDHESYLEEHTTFGQGALVRARVVRVFTFDNEAAGEAGREALIDAAESSGWEMNLEDKPVFGTAVSGTKTLATGEATLDIGLYEQEGVIKASVWLEHK